MRVLMAWCGWCVCLGLMVIGTMLVDMRVLAWGLVTAAMSATMTVGVFCSRNSSRVRELLLLSRDVNREGLMPVQRVPRD